jgi:hypothetical protein
MVRDKPVPHIPVPTPDFPPFLALVVGLLLGVALAMLVQG